MSSSPHLALPRRTRPPSCDSEPTIRPRLYLPTCLPKWFRPTRIASRPRLQSPAPARPLTCKPVSSQPCALGPTYLPSAARTQRPHLCTRLRLHSHVPRIDCARLLRHVSQKYTQSLTCCNTVVVRAALAFTRAHASRKPTTPDAACEARTPRSQLRLQRTGRTRARIRLTTLALVSKSRTRLNRATRARLFLQTPALRSSSKNFCAGIMCTLDFIVNISLPGRLV
ncbi:hypothetical protein B0H10DRAFT_317629 [Mycena sp. CBHHK59/15]|nr:hypothetical protein B0H10DRAFT_317629 [Mycena sp. CBHHK59/15]